MNPLFFNIETDGSTGTQVATVLLGNTPMFRIWTGTRYADESLILAEQVVAVGLTDLLYRQGRLDGYRVMFPNHPQWEDYPWCDEEIPRLGTGDWRSSPLSAPPGREELGGSSLPISEP